MKKVLITGANSYVGTSFEKWMSQWPDKYHVDTIDMIDGSWRGKSFAGYDAVFHVAGIAHVSADPSNKDLYYKINRDLAIETAEKAKSDGARQFVFMSSSIVYGDSAPIGKTKVITKDTPVSPSNFYGDSKVQAENGIVPLNNEKFKVVILRPPMVYGKGSKGNYPALAKLAVKLPVFPYVDNQRSMLYIDNLCEFVRLMIENSEHGMFWPQNAEYSNTSNMVIMIAKTHDKKIVILKGTLQVLKILSLCTDLVDKAFGNFTYDMNISEYKQNYQLYSLGMSIGLTEI